MVVKSAFLNGDLKEELNVSQPPSFEVLDKEAYVYRLSNALYSLKQTPCAWNKKMDLFLKELSFQRLLAYYNLYFLWDQDWFCILVIYVDDLVIIVNGSFLAYKVKASLCKQFEMINLGILHFFLGLEIQQSSSGMCVSQ